MAEKTSAFWNWVFGWFVPQRERRLHLRDALLMPRVEAGIAILVAEATFLLGLIPWGPLETAALALHRVNGLYLGALGAYALLVLAAKRRDESPYPTIIEDGHIVHRDVQFTARA